MKNKQTICYVAGKSGGHIIPCLTMAYEHKQKKPDDNVLFFTTDSLLDIEIASQSSDITWHIPLPLKKAHVNRWFELLIISVNLVATIAKSLYHLIMHRPKKIVCTGGFLAIPVIICARLLAIPAEIFELNVEPGRATTFLSSWSVKILTCFWQTQKHLPKKKCEKTAYPIRFFGTEAQMSQKEALQKIGFSTHRKTVVVLGGSQGSLEINSLIQQWVIDSPHLHNHIQIVHQTGRQDAFDWQSFYAQHNIPAKTFSFCHSMAEYYAAADLIICRSGAGTLFEILFFGKNCISIPLLTKQNKHQLANALAMRDEYGDQFTVITSEQLRHSKQKLYSSMIEKLDLGYTQPGKTPFTQHEL